VVQRLCKDQHIPNFIFHELRHCAVTNLADIGVDIETIMKIVGHSSVEMFLRYRKIKATSWTQPCGGWIRRLTP
jgi:integrase